MEKAARGLLQFFRDNQFALITAGGWLVAIWSLVLIADAYFGRTFSLTEWGGSWDGAWYRSIIEQGYTPGHPMGQVNVAFFPVYPLVVGFFAALTHLPVIWVGMAVSILCFTAMLVLLYKLVATHFSEKIAKWTVLLLAFNPFSFYFGMMYTESLFALLATATFWFVLRKQWWLAALVAGLASATRSVGIALSITVVAAWLWEHRKALWQAGSWEIVGVWLLSISGLLLFSLYLWFHNGDFLAYRSAQEFWPGRGGMSNILNELSYLFAHKTINLQYMLTLMWYVVTVLAFIGVWLVIRMRQWLLALYAVVALALPILFGTAASMNRYVQVVVPVFIVYAALLQKQRPLVKASALGLCAVSLVIAIFLVVNPRAAFVG